jgi:hypothetical protein
VTKDILKREVNNGEQCWKKIRNNFFGQFEQGEKRSWDGSLVTDQPIILGAAPAVPQK